MTLWWIVAAILLALVALKAWRVYKHPAHQLGMQAAKLGWRAAGSIKDPSTIRCRRDGPDGPRPELKRWVSQTKVNLAVIA